jgi:hypothetical protein
MPALPGGRKIVSFTTMPGSTALSWFIFSLCDDGSMWFLIWGLDLTQEYSWQRIPQGVPGDDEG